MCLPDYCEFVTLFCQLLTQSSKSKAYPALHASLMGQKKDSCGCLSFLEKYL